MKLSPLSENSLSATARLSLLPLCEKSLSSACEDSTSSLSPKSMKPSSSSSSATSCANCSRSGERRRGTLCFCPPCLSRGLLVSLSSLCLSLGLSPLLSSLPASLAPPGCSTQPSTWALMRSPRTSSPQTGQGNRRADDWLCASTETMSSLSASPCASLSPRGSACLCFLRTALPLSPRSSSELSISSSSCVSTSA